MTLDRMTVKAKLASGYGLLVVALLVVAALSLHALSEANEHFTSYMTGANARAMTVHDIQDGVDRRAIAARNLVLVKRQSDIDLEKQDVLQAHTNVQSKLKHLQELAATSDGKTQALVYEIARVESLYGPVALNIVDLALAGKQEAATTMIDEQCRPLLAALVKATREYAGYAQTQQAEALEQSSQAYSTQRAILLGICSVAVLAAVFSGYLMTVSLTRSLGAEPAALGALAQRVASGDVSLITGAALAPTGSVLASMGQMQTSLEKLIGEVRGAARNIATGSGEIAAGNVNLSARTEQQAASLQETATSMEQLTATVRQNAENAKQASALSAYTRRRSVDLHMKFVDDVARSVLP